MKTETTLLIIMTAFFLLPKCTENQEKKLSVENTVDIIDEKFPTAQEEVKAVLDSLFLSIQNRDVDQLLSFHAYSDKFTAFGNGLPRLGSERNEADERQLIQNISAFDYELGDLKIAVFNNVAIVTFNADFRPTIDGTIVQLWEQGTLVFVKNKKAWRITHEHFSPMQAAENKEKI